MVTHSTKTIEREFDKTKEKRNRYCKHPLVTQELIRVPKGKYCKFSSINSLVVTQLPSGLFCADFHAKFYVFCTMNHQMHNYLINYHNAPTCFDTIVSSLGSS
jgi:hypothetical protein